MPSCYAVRKAIHMSEMDAAPDGPVVSVSLGYRNLRALFIAGFVLEIILTFVPSRGADGRSFSDFESIRWAFQQGRDGLAFLSVSMFCFTVACAALAIAYPRRWVFIAGACFAAFGLIRRALLRLKRKRLLSSAALGLRRDSDGAHGLLDQAARHLLAPAVSAAGAFSAHGTAGGKTTGATSPSSATP